MTGNDETHADDLLTTDEVAEILRTTAATMRWYAHVGKGPRSFRHGRRRLYVRADVEAYIAESRGLSA